MTVYTQTEIVIKVSSILLKEEDAKGIMEAAKQLGVGYRTFIKLRDKYFLTLSTMQKVCRKLRLGYLFEVYSIDGNTLYPDQVSRMISEYITKNKIQLNLSHKPISDIHNYKPMARSLYMRICKHLGIQIRPLYALNKGERKVYLPVVQDRYEVEGNEMTAIELSIYISQILKQKDLPNLKGIQPKKYLNLLRGLALTKKEYENICGQLDIKIEQLQKVK